MIVVIFAERKVILLEIVQMRKKKIDIQIKINIFYTFQKNMKVLMKLKLRVMTNRCHVLIVKKVLQLIMVYNFTKLTRGVSSMIVRENLHHHDCDGNTPDQRPVRVPQIS